MLDRPLGSGSDRQEEEVNLAVVLVILVVRGKQCRAEAAPETANHGARPSRVPQTADYLGVKAEPETRPPESEKADVL